MSPPASPLLLSIIVNPAAPSSPLVVVDEDSDDADADTDADTETSPENDWMVLPSGGLSGVFLEA